MDINSMDKQSREAIRYLFENLADLPEVSEDQLELGSYTNAQIIEKVPNPIVLTQLIVNLPDVGSAALRRTFLSIQVDKLGSE